MGHLEAVRISRLCILKSVLPADKFRYLSDNDYLCVCNFSC